MFLTYFPLGYLFCAVPEYKSALGILVCIPYGIDTVRKICFILMFVFFNFILYWSIIYFGASLVAQLGKKLPAVQETRVRYLGQEDPLEKEMATHSSILAWRISWTGEPGGPQSMGSQESDMT